MYAFERGERPSIEVVVEVEGGVVTDVICTNDDVDFTWILRDHDDEEFERNRRDPDHLLNQGDDVDGQDPKGHWLVHVRMNWPGPGHNFSEEWLTLPGTIRREQVEQEAIDAMALGEIEQAQKKPWYRPATHISVTDVKWIEGS
jgi:hypothetical protein